MNQIYNSKKECFGCGACASICPKSAIFMKDDQEGFSYPIIKQEKCVNCKMCVKVCPFHEGGAKSALESKYVQRYFAVQHKNTDVVANSSSGGMFTALSDCVLAHNGVVYGAAFGVGFTVIHERAQDAEKRNSFRGSKYIQSNMNSVYHLILEDLNLNKPVLFSGTPCQVAGVKNYILHKRQSLDNLLLCDFICHGVASPKVWKSYINYFSEKYDGGLVYYEFRNKKDGWKQIKPVLITMNKDVSQEYNRKNSFMQLYKTCYLDRPSCYACKYASYNRCSDITIADFWNIAAVYSEMDDNTGTSQVLINTTAGQQWFDLCHESIKHYECGKKDVWQPHLEYPAYANASKRAQFWELYSSIPFEKVLKKYGQGNMISKCIHFFTPVVKKLGLYVLAGKIYRMIFVRKK